MRFLTELADDAMTVLAYVVGIVFMVLAFCAGICAMVFCVCSAVFGGLGNLFFWLTDLLSATGHFTATGDLEPLAKTWVWPWTKEGSDQDVT